MATVVPPELKTELMSRGVWADFIRRREDIQAESGGTTRACSVAALEELAPDLADQMRPRGRPPSNPLKKNAVQKPAPELVDRPEAKKVPLADAKRIARDKRAEDTQWRAHGVDSEQSVWRVKREVFANKSCSNMQSLIWAVESLAFDDVKAEDAPSAFAWSMFLMMVQSPSTKADIAKVVAAKIAQRASNEEDNGGGFDGEGEYDLLATLAKGGEE